MTTRLEEQNTELTNSFALSEQGIWEKIGLLDPVATGTASAVARMSGAMGPAQPERLSGLEPGRLGVLEAAFKELGKRLSAVDAAQAVQLPSVNTQAAALGATMSNLERSVIELVRRATLLEACPEVPRGYAQRTMDQ